MTKSKAPALEAAKAKIADLATTLKEAKETIVDLATKLRKAEADAVEYLAMVAELQDVREGADELILRLQQENETLRQERDLASDNAGYYIAKYNEVAGERDTAVERTQATPRPRFPVYMDMGGHNANGISPR